MDQAGTSDRQTLYQKDTITQILTPKSKIQNPKSKIQNPKSKIQYPKKT